MRAQAILCLMLQLIFELSSCEHLRVIPGATLELPCLSNQPLPHFTAANIIWTFNGQNISTDLPGSAKIKKDGLYISISPVTSANEGEYACLVKKSNMEIIRVYSVSVDASIVYTIKGIQGSTIYLPCHFPHSHDVIADALWFKEIGVGIGPRLQLGDGSTGDSERVEQLYPMDHDQTLILRDTIMEDVGTYNCESAEGEKLSTVHLVVEVPPTQVRYSCGNFTSAWEPCHNENSRSWEPMLQESIAEFSMKLYSYLRESQPSSNLLFSPISISTILSYLLLGARGDTRRAIEVALCVPHDFHCVHFQTGKLREKLKDSLKMASQIYYNPGMNLSESFTDQSIQFYDTTPVKLLESSEDNTQMINSWVANKTDNKIKNFVDSVSPSTQLIMVNAVSFRGQWKIKFAEKHKKGFFRKLNGDMVMVPILYDSKSKTSVAFNVGLKAQVARFALTGDTSLYILLPRSHTLVDLQEVEEKMTDTAVHQMIDEMKRHSPERVELSLPKVKLDIQSDMHLLFRKLGLTSLFEDANLCGLNSEETLVLDEARHRAFLELTEKGVEAGAASSVIFSRTYLTFSALRPFIMLLWNDQANVPLFIGRVTEP